MDIPFQDISATMNERTAAANATAEPCVATASATGLSPQLVTRGETHERCDHASAGIAFIDWLGFSVRLPPGQDQLWLEHALQTTFAVPPAGWEDSGRGWFGYQNRIDLADRGLLAYGGAAQKGTYHVELSGHGCRYIRDWNAVRLWGEVYGATVTRTDLAHDDFAGTVINIEQALEWWSSGLFNVNGRPPRGEFIDDMGSNRGRTLYVGRRASGKLSRVYEKGKQLGKPSDPWVRVEVELRNKGRVVPWTAVTAPGNFLAAPIQPSSSFPVSSLVCRPLRKPQRSITKRWCATSVSRGESR